MGEAGGGRASDPERLLEDGYAETGAFAPGFRAGGLRPLPGYVSAPDGTEFRQGPKVDLMMRQTPKSLSPVAGVGSDWARPKGRRRRLFRGKAGPVRRRASSLDLLNEIAQRANNFYFF